MVTEKNAPTLDLSGEICPYTFVRTKLALEELEAGEELRVVVDHEPATQSVPRSCREIGHEVLSVARLSATHWEIVVRKRVL